MIFLGIDIGSLTGKAVLLQDDEIIAQKVIRVKKMPIFTVKELLKHIFSQSGLQQSDIAYCVGTGYGRHNLQIVNIINESISEITCHGTGAYWLNQDIRTIIDIGGQDCKVIRIDDKGKLKNFIMNEKCAAGTGRYLELMAETLKLELEELGPISLKSKTPVALIDNCSIFAQAEVLQRVSDGRKKRDIAAGVNKAMAERVINLAEKIGIQEEVTVSGGVAKNIGVYKSMENILKLKFLELPQDPQIVGALGAAILAEKAYKKKNTS
ncbi:MAG: acyl-CoA dehydratase activase [Candidatus Helarchaeota archaeon]